MRDLETGEVIETIDGLPNSRYFYPYQYMQFRLDGGRLMGTSTQGAGEQLRTVDIGANFRARKVGDTTVFSAPISVASGKIKKPQSRLRDCG